MTTLIDTLLLFSLPASGKSEVRRYLAHLTPEQCREDFGLARPRSSTTTPTST